jgi:branched-chain amino acid transport system permease protein
MPNRPLVTSYRQDFQLFPGRWQKAGLTIAVLIMVLYPLLADDYWMSIGNKALITIVGATALMILTGFAGQISLGHAAFFAIGAYTAAILGKQNIPFWLCMPVSGLAAGLVGLLVGPFALRLKGVYLAIVTLGLIYLVNHVLFTLSDWTGGPAGSAVPMYGWFVSAGEESMLGTFNAPLEIGPLFFTFEQKLYLVFLPLTLYVVYFAKNLQRSDLGRAMMAVRDKDLAAQAMGIHLGRTRIQALFISSFIAGVGGAMLAFKQQFITIDPPFNLVFSIEYIAMIVLGGSGTVFGAVAGALAFVFLSPLAEIVGSRIPLLNQLTNAEQSVLLFSFLVGAILIYEPLGIFGLWLRIKRFFLAWPFKR